MAVLPAGRRPPGTHPAGACFGHSGSTAGVDHRQIRVEQFPVALTGDRQRRGCRNLVPLRQTLGSRSRPDCYQRPGWAPSRPAAAHCWRTTRTPRRPASRSRSRTGPAPAQQESRGTSCRRCHWSSHRRARLGPKAPLGHQVSGHAGDGRDLDCGGVRTGSTTASWGPRWPATTSCPPVPARPATTNPPSGSAGQAAMSK